VSDSKPLKGKTALVTGSAARLGAASVRHLHAAGAHVIIHYRNSSDRARALQAELLRAEPDSASLIQGDLLDIPAIPSLVERALQATGRLDILVNNASNYYPTPMDKVSIEQWDDLFGVNAKAPFFLAKSAAPGLRETAGCIINMVDIHAERPNKDYPVYSMAKAANAMMVQSLARELAPDIRVNGVAPGAILWPEGDPEDSAKVLALPRIPLGRAGTPDDIASTVVFLATANYITGQIISVDGGRTTHQ